MLNKNFIFSIYKGLSIISFVVILGFTSCRTSIEDPIVINASNYSGPVYPAIPVDLIGEKIDTIITFDPKTFEESISYEIQQPEKKQVSDKVTVIDLETQKVDTIITFDPDTYSESMTVIRYTNDGADTIKVY